MHHELQFSFGAAPKPPAMPKQYRDKYNYLVARRAIVTGNHPDKGVHVDIKASLGNGLVKVANVGGQWLRQLRVSQLLDPQ